MNNLKENIVNALQNKLIEGQIKDDSYNELMEYLYENYISEGLMDNFDDFEDILYLVERFVYLNELIKTDKDLDDMDDLELLELDEVKELLQKIKDEAEELAKVKHYDGGIELSNRKLMYEITNNEVDSDTFWDNADAALEAFGLDNNIPVDDIGVAGRSSSHVILKDSYAYAKRYNELVEKCNKMQDEFVENMNNFKYDD